MRSPILYARCPAHIAEATEASFGLCVKALGGCCGFPLQGFLLVVGWFDRLDVDSGDGHMRLLAECPDRLLRRPTATVLDLPQCRRRKAEP